MSDQQSSPARFDVIVGGAGLTGLYQLYKARELGLRVRVYEAGSAVARARGTGIATPAPAATRRAISINTGFPMNCSTSGTGANASPPSLKRSAT